MKWLLPILCIACGGPDRDGIEFAWESPEFRIGILPGPLDGYFSPDVVDISAGHVISAMAERGYSLTSMRWATQSVRIQLEPGPNFPCPKFLYPNARCDGEQLDYKLRIAAKDCVWRTALMHEHIHFLLGYETGDPDAQHTLSQVWPIAGVQLGECPTGE